MSIEDSIIQIGRSLFDEKIISFIIFYTFLGLLVITLKYSILGSKKKMEIWKEQNFLSKIVYGFIVGISSWIGAIPFTFLFYYLWSKIETVPNLEITLGLPIVIFTLLYGSIALRNKKIKEEIKPFSIFIFAYYSISFVSFLLFVAITIEKITFKEYVSAIVLSLISVLFLIPFLCRKKFIRAVLEDLKEYV